MSSDEEKKGRESWIHLSLSLSPPCLLLQQQALAPTPPTRSLTQQKHEGRKSALRRSRRRVAAMDLLYELDDGQYGGAAIGPLKRFFCSAATRGTAVKNRTTADKKTHNKSFCCGF